MKFELPKLSYSYDSLEPYIDKETMEIHHSKHHNGYIENLNRALEGHADLSGSAVEELLTRVDSLPEDIRQAVINNAGGHYNHSFFWKIMTPTKNEPSEFMNKEIAKVFGSVEDFKQKFSEKALSVFGSGWAFLIVDGNKKLTLKRQSFQNTPITDGNLPVLGVDVWEHAYYLKYQNRRKDYIDAWWNVINWTEAELNLKKALK